MFQKQKQISHEQSRQSSLFINLNDSHVESLMNLKPVQVQQLRDELKEQQETLTVLEELTQMSVSLAHDLLQCNSSGAE